MAGIQLQTIPNSSRVHRRPRHKFVVAAFPYVLTPFMASPVWPGESLVNSWFEAREVSKPLVNAITGWGSEWYLFYCKLSDLIDYPQVMSMLIDPTNAELTGTGPGYDASARFYHAAGGRPNFMRMCYDRICKVYFRDADELLGGGSYSSFESSTYWKAKYKDHGIFDSLTPGTFDDGSAVPPAASGMDDLARAADLYEYLVAAQLTDLSYSDWCAAYGVKIPAAEKNEPELLLKWTEWVYPSNTVDPATGTPSSALSFVIKKSFNEPRYFKEPGFLIGIHLLRPKLYSLDQLQNANAYLNTALAWLPAMLSADPSTSLREFDASQILRSPTVPTDKMIVDMRDVPMYGDQFTNFALTDAEAKVFVNMGGPESRLAYPHNDDVDALFKSPTNNYAAADGFINLDIVGRIVDYTTAGTAAM